MRSHSDATHIHAVLRRRQAALNHDPRLPSPRAIADHAETALIWACDTSESLLRGGISCASNGTALRVPTLGMYIAHAQVTMTCKQSGGKVGVLPSARLLAGSNSREMALAHLSGCVRNEGYATMQLRRICELVAGDEVSVMVTHAWRLHGAFKLTYFDLHLLPEHQD